jgi:membrane AbrB-like protein
MNGYAGLILIYIVGTAGYIAFSKIKMPLPALLGSLTFTAVLAFTNLFPDCPVGEMSAICKIVMGILVGRRINRKSMNLLRGMVLPAIFISVWMIVLSILSGFLMARISSIPLSTGLVGTTTGGVNEMAIFALSMNYDVATVTIISVTRLITVLALTPWLAKRWARRLSGDANYEGGGTPARSKISDSISSTKITFFGICILTACSVFGGYLFEFFKVPAGFMLGSLFFSGIFTMISDFDYDIPVYIVNAVQIGLGIAIAKYFGPEQLGYLTNPRFITSLLICTAFSISATLVLALLVQKATKWDPLTCLLSTSAGGLTQMTVVSEEMGADSLAVGILHLTRYLVIVSCMPVIIKLFL